MIRSLAFTPDSSVLAIGSDDDVVRIRDRATGQFRRRYKGHLDDLAAIAVAPDGNTLASASDEKTALIWDFTTLGIE